MTMDDPLPVVLTCAVIIGLLGLAEFLRPWRPPNPQPPNPQYWKGIVFQFLFFIATLVGCGVYSRTQSTQAPLFLLLGVYWIYGRFIQILVFWRTGNRTLQISTCTSGLIAGILQLSGIVVSLCTPGTTARWIATSGVIVSLFTFRSCEVWQIRSNHQAPITWHMVVFTALWILVPLGTIGFRWIPDELWFYLAHCFFHCIELLNIHSVRPWTTWRLTPNNQLRFRGLSSALGDWGHENQPSSIYEVTASKSGGPTQVFSTFTEDGQSTQKNSPPVTPLTASTVPAPINPTLCPSHGEPSNYSQDMEKGTFCSLDDSSSIHVVDITGYASGIRVRILVVRDDTKMVQLVEMDWTALYPSWIKRIEELVGKFAYTNVLTFLGSRTVSGRTIFAGSDFQEFVESRYVGALLHGSLVPLKVGRAALSE